MDQFYREFGQRVKLARNAAKMSQERVADVVGLNRTSITNIERGRQHITLHTLYLLASAVGVSPQALLPERVDHSAIDPATAKAIQKVGLSEEVRDWLREILAADNVIHQGGD